MSLRALLGLMAFVGCGRSPGGADRSAPSASSPSGAVAPSLPSGASAIAPVVTAARPGHSPLRITWEPHGAPTAGRSLALTARIERAAHFDRPLRVVVRVPAGARVDRGPLTLDLPPSPTPRVDAVEYVLALATVPTSDLVLLADVRGTDWGAHAEVAYRFGRPEPTVRGPAAEGPRVVVGGIDLGPAVPAGRR